MPRGPLKDTPKLRLARERFKFANDADNDQALRERDDLAFYANDQWPADIRAARQGQQPINGMPAVPARPTLTINKVREPIRQIQNQIRGSDLGVELVPADDFGDLGIVPDDTEITLREGLVRRTLRSSDAQSAVNWAGDRADIAGRGYCLVTSRYLPGKTWDQEIIVDRIYNQASVLLDPSHTMPDGSDADWGFVGTWMTWDKYRSIHGRLGDGTTNPFSDYGEADFMALTEEYPDWYRATNARGDQATSDITERAVRITDYWYVERERRELVQLTTGESMWADEVPKGAAIAVDEDGAELRRDVIETTVKFCKIGGGVQILEETESASPDMPIVKVIGEELQPFDHERRCEGMVRNARDAQQGFNYLISKFVETVGLAPIPRDRVDPEAIEGYEAWWAVANTRTLPYLPYRSRDDNGKEFNAPLPGNADPNILPLAQGLAIFDATIKSTTAVPDPTLGNVDPTLKSGRAIREVVNNAQQSTSNFLENRILAWRRVGTIINNMLFPIYGSRPGRIVRIMTGEGEAQMMRIDHPEQQQQAAQQQQKALKVGKLTKDAHFNVVIKITKNSERRRDQFTAMFAEILSADPQQMAVGGDLFYQNMDIPHAKQLAERQRTVLLPPVQAMLAAKEQGQDFDPAAQAKIAELQQRLQHAEAALKELDDVANGKKLENQTKMQVEVLKAQADLEKVRLEAARDAALEEMRLKMELEKDRAKNATAIAVAEIQARSKGVISADEQTNKAIALAHEAHESDLDRQHAAQLADQQAANAAAMAGAQADVQGAESEAQRSHEQEMAAQAAQAQPAESA